MYGFVLSILADAHLAAGQPAEGLPLAQEAIDLAERTDNRYCEPEFHRLKGELLLQAGAAQGEAEKSLREAIAIARRQTAKSWELRAATSLARLLSKQGKVQEAQPLLSEVYNWFTEGFATADLKDAKALLDELSAQP